MKRLLLYGATMIISLSTFAQGNKIYSAKEAIKFRDQMKKSEMVSTPNQKHSLNPIKPQVNRGPLNSTQAVTLIPIGTSANAFGTIGIRSNIDYNPDINTVTFIHRSDAAGGLGASSGEYYFDASYDGGATWAINNGPLYLNTGNVDGGRYPNAVIYNPSGNTTPANGFITYYGPLTNIAAGGWAADVHGSGNLVAPVTATETVTQHPYPDGTDLVVADGMVITQTTRETYLYDPQLPDELTTSYTGTLQVRHGVWNGTNDMNYNTVFVNLPVSVDANDGTSDFGSTSNVAFGNDGLTGYALIVGHYDYVANPDSAYFLIISKTTDGGTTWGAPFYLTYSAIDGLLNSSGAGNYMNWVDADAVVDMNNNLHINTTIGASPGGYSISTSPGEVGVFDIYTTDQGTTWKAELLGGIQAFSVNYTGGANTDTYYQRGQASRTWSGDKVFFTWFDTDSATFATTNNEFPDVHVRAYDVVNNLWTSEMNLTQGTAADGSCTYGNVGPYVIATTGGNKIAASYVSIITDISSSVQHVYMDGLTINNADFTQAPNSVTLTMTPTGIETPGAISNASNIYPNPSQGDCYMSVTLAETSNITVSFINTMGQEVATQKMGNLIAGQNTLKLDTRNLSQGIYMVRIKAGVNSVVRKLSVN